MVTLKSLPIDVSCQLTRIASISLSMGVFDKFIVLIKNEIWLKIIFIFNEFNYTNFKFN